MSKSNSPPDVKSIRAVIRDLRRSISKPQRAAASARICQFVREMELFKSAKMIGGFLAFDGEADPLGAMIHAHQMQQKVFVPIIVGKSKPLVFAPWTPGCPMKNNSFGIAEPDVSHDQCVAADQLDFVITPLVAFDEKRHRIGVGGGYYDRSFAFLIPDDQRADSSPERPTRLVGFAFELQRVEKIVAQPWDVSLDAVATEWKIR